MARICILLNSHWESARGGAELQAHLLAEYFTTNSDHEVYYLANHTPEESQQYPYEIRGFSGPTLFRRRRLGRIPNLPALYRALNAIAPDVIIHMVASAYTGFAAWYAKRKGIPLYFYLASDKDVSRDPNVGVNGPTRFLDTLLYFYGLRHATYIIAQTQRQRDALQHLVGRDCTLVVPNFLPAPGHVERSSPNFRVAWVANVKGLKRPELFVELARSCAEVPELEFWMAGRGGDPGLVELIERAVAELKNLTYYGELTLEAVERQLSDTDVLVNTSDYEGFPNTFIQAWLRGVPVLSLNVDPDGVLGKQNVGIHTLDIPCTRVHLLRLLSEPSLLKQMAENSRRHASLYHSMDNAGDVLSHINGHLRNHPHFPEDQQT